MTRKRPALFRGRHFEDVIILLCVRWYLLFVDKTSSFANNASAGKLLRCRAFVTVMRAAEVRNPDDLSDTQDLPNMRTLLVDS